MATTEWEIRDDERSQVLAEVEWWAKCHTGFMLPERNAIMRAVDGVRGGPDHVLWRRGQLEMPEGDEITVEFAVGSTWKLARPGHTSKGRTGDLVVVDGVKPNRVHFHYLKYDQLPGWAMKETFLQLFDFLEVPQ